MGPQQLSWLCHTQRKLTQQVACGMFTLPEKRSVIFWLISVTAQFVVSPLMASQQQKKEQATTVLSNCISTLNQTQTHDPQYDLLIC